MLGSSRALHSPRASLKSAFADRVAGALLNPAAHPARMLGMDSRAFITVAVLILAHLAIAAITPAFMHHLGPGDLWPYLFMGVCASQVNLVAMWAVFAPGPIAWRWPWAGLLGIGMWVTLVVSNRVVFWLDNRDGFPRSDALLLGGVLFGGMLVAQIPLWIIRQFLAYRLYPPGDQQVDDRQFNLRQLLIGIALCSVGLGLLRVVLPPQEERWYGPSPGEITFILTVIATVNLLMTLPCMWLALTCRRGMFVWLAMVFVGYAFVVSLLELIVLHTVQGRSPPDTEEFRGIWLFNTSQGLSIALTLVVLRTAGFRWEVRRESDKLDGIPAGQTEDPATDGVAEGAPHPLD
jgi:hypothetical protein